MDQVAGTPSTRLPLQIFTVGHSDHTLEEFHSLLRKHGIGLIVDVRSQPYSQWVPQFNRENLVRSLTEAGLHYHFLGDKLGGRPADRTMYDPGQEFPDYERLAASSTYLDGITRLLALASDAASAKERQGAENSAPDSQGEAQRVAILCSEGDFRKCHRGKLITPTLLRRGVRVTHIQPDGTLVEADLEPRQLAFL